MPVYTWTAVFAGGLASGAAVVGLLSMRKALVPVFLLLGAAGIMLGTWGIAGVIQYYGRADLTVAAVLLSLGALAGGYGLGSVLLGYLVPRPPAAPLSEVARPEDRKPAVLVLTCIEPESFDPRATAIELEDLAKAGMPEATVGVTPFLFAAQKARYRAAGGKSPSFNQARAVTERLESLLGDTVSTVRLVTCSGVDTLESAVRELAEQDVGHIITAVLSVGESYPIDRAKTHLDTLRPERHGLTIVHTPPLWGSERIAEMIASRIWAARDEPELTGVALVLHGQPEPWQQTHAAFDVQENAFANRVRMLLAERGIPQDKVRLCYADWHTPDVTETVRHLAALGCRRVLVSPVCYPFEDVSTILDLQVAVRQARVEAHVTTVTLSAWGDEPVVAETLQDAVRESARELAVLA